MGDEHTVRTDTQTNRLEKELDVHIYGGMYTQGRWSYRVDGLMGGVAGGGACEHMVGGQTSNYIQ